MSSEHDSTSPDGGGSRLGRLARRTSRVLGRIGRSVVGGGEEAALARQIEIPIRTVAPEANEWREIESGFAMLAEQGLWTSVLQRLRGVDQSRQQFVSGKRYFECALAGALAPVTRHLRSTPDLDKAEDALSVFVEVQAGHPEDYVAAVLLAAALGEIGWAERGTAPPDATPGDDAVRARNLFSRAETVLEAFDPIQENSPMLAEVRYRLAPGLEGGHRALRDWYEDWADLDPSNPRALVTHGGFLLPEWYGDYDEIAREARRAVARAVEGLGAGAYLYLWRPALESRTEALDHIDADLLVAGIDSTLQATMSQHLANDFAGLLLRLSGPVAEGDNDDPGAATRARLARGFGEVLRQHLREVQVPLWGIDEPAIRQAIAEEFRDELAQGLKIRPGAHGLEAVPPDAED